MLGRTKGLGRIATDLRAVVAVGGVVALLFVSIPGALADNGPHQGATFGTKPDACAGCHRIHTAQGPRLLKESSQAGLCLTCHDGTGANTNVVNGVSESTGLGLKGGGFTSALMDPELNGTPTSAAASSTHTVDGTSATAWGGGAISGTASYGTTITLECGNCHNPHGNGQYRILRRTPNEGYGDTAVSVADEVTKNYDVSYLETSFRDTSYAPTNVEEWCSQCHSRYLAGVGGGSNHSGDAVFTYRHMTNGLMDGCLRCHVAHGTSADMDTYSGAVLLPNGTPGGGPTDSRLLHVTNRGVCAQCHVGSEGVGIGGSCTACHGQPPTTGSHSTHYTAIYGPGISTCNTCHLFDSGTHMNGQVNFADATVSLSATTVCNTCHSPGGTYDGVANVTIGAKSNWASGVYTGSSLITGKEKWCAGCHDESPSIVSGIRAPEVIGNESATTNYGTGYGYYKTGHGLPSDQTYPATEDSGAGLGCLACHDATVTHLDGAARTYVVASDNYQAGYRLKDVGGGVPMDVPKTDSGVPASDFALCFQCHASSPYVTSGDNSSYFRASYDHYWHLNQSDNLWDSDASDSPPPPYAADSRNSCVACHNVHGSRTPAMTRSGELISDPGTTNKTPALDFQYRPTGTYPVRASSTGGWCETLCHGSEGYNRTP